MGSEQQKAPLARGFLREVPHGVRGWGAVRYPSVAVDSWKHCSVPELRHLIDYHSFQASPAQYPRPLCSRKVMLGPGFQVSS